MKLRLAFIIFIIMLSFSCRKKVADDYAYYQPYKRAKVSVNDSISPTTTNDSVPSKENTVEEIIKPVNLNDKYFIVVASFSVEEYAITMKHELMKQGYKPQIFMLRNDGWNKLAILSYNDFEEATQELERIKLKGDLFEKARIVIK